MRISEREKLVLNAIVDYYLTVGDTIGSRTLVKKYGIELSSATIRNVMADLEDMGFIEKTHTSSGRIPTDMGYKYYLTELLKVEKITQEEIENISNVYNRRVDELENILKKTSTLLSKLTNYAGIAVEPKPDNKKVSRVELVYIDEYLIMAIIVMDDRRVKTKSIHLPYPITKEEVEKKADELNAKIRNNEIAINDIEKFFTESTDIVYEYDDEDELTKYFINNLPSMLKNENIAGVTDVIEFFNERKDIRELFEKLIEQKAQENSKSNVNVILGDELGIKELEDFSFVYSIYDIGGAQGIIGVMGPKRMAYSKTMGLINHVSREVNKLIKTEYLMTKSLIRMRMSSHDAHYGGNLVDGAKMLQLFGDVATELLIINDGDEGLFCAYDNVEFLAPVFAGDYIEAVGEITSVGNSSRKMKFEARKVIAPRTDISASAADVLAEPIVVCRATGTCVVPKDCQRIKH